MTVPALTNKANLEALLGTDTIPTDETREPVHVQGMVRVLADWMAFVKPNSCEIRI